MDYIIREIEEKDDLIVEKIIRDCLIEFGGNHEGTAWCDPDLYRFSKIYNTEGNRYWVAEKDGQVVGGVGIGKMEIEGMCELQKMYCIKEVRGTGIAHLLLQKALCYAKSRYTSVYLETLDNMTGAMRFYEKHGFKRVEKPTEETGHFACDICYEKKL